MLPWHKERSVERRCMFVSEMRRKTAVPIVLDSPRYIVDNRIDPKFFRSVGCPKSELLTSVSVDRGVRTFRFSTQGRLRRTPGNIFVELFRKQADAEHSFPAIDAWNNPLSRILRSPFPMLLALQTRLEPKNTSWTRFRFVYHLLREFFRDSVEWHLLISFRQERSSNARFLPLPCFFLNE